MKNKSDGSVDISNSSLKLKMRLSFILFFAFIFSAVANSFSQTEISLELRDVKVIDVLDEIEVGTDYKFFYNTNIYDFNKVVSKLKLKILIRLTQPYRVSTLPGADF